MVSATIDVDLLNQLKWARFCPGLHPVLQYRQRDAPTSNNLDHICVAKDARDLKCLATPERSHLFLENATSLSAST